MDYKKFYSDNMWIFVLIVVLIILFLFYRYCWEKKSLESDLSFRNVESRVTALENQLGFHTQQQAQLQAQQQALQQTRTATGAPFQGTNQYGEQCNCDTQGNMNQPAGSSQQYPNATRATDGTRHAHHRYNQSSSYGENIDGELNNY